MIRFEDEITVKDRAGRTCSAGELLLTLEDGTAVYEISGSADEVMFCFSGENVPLYQMEVHKMCAAVSREDSLRRYILWPLLPLFSIPKEKFCGFTALRAEVRGELRPLDVCLRHRAENPPADGKLPLYDLAVALNLAGIFLNVERQNYLIGYVDPRDFFVDGAAHVFYCGAYHCGLNLQTGWNRYTAPEKLETGLKNGRDTAQSDAFGYAVLLFELLTGRKPFGEPDSDEELESRMLNGESVYYDEMSPECLETEAFFRSLSPELAEAFQNTFNYCGNEQYDSFRPSVEQWLVLLKKLWQKLQCVERELGK